jgi:hypothetical protein
LLHFLRTCHTQTLINFTQPTILLIQQFVSTVYKIFKPTILLVYFWNFPQMISVWFTQNASYSNIYYLFVILKLSLVFNDDLFFWYIYVQESPVDQEHNGFHCIRSLTWHTKHCVHFFYLIYMEQKLISYKIRIIIVCLIKSSYVTA